MVKRTQPIGIELVKRGVVTEADVNKALEYQKKLILQKKLGDIINELHLCDSYRLIKEIGEILGEKTILLELEDVKVNITDYISMDMAKKNRAIPFEVGAGKNKKYVSLMEQIKNDRCYEIIIPKQRTCNG